MSNKIKKFWVAHEQKILVVLAIFLSSLVSFQMGKNSQKLDQSEVIKVNLASEGRSVLSPEERSAGVSGAQSPSAGLGDSSQLAAGNGQPTSTGCKFVASKSSNKFHLPDCRYAAKIDEDNRLCFASEEEAKQKGYQPAKCCIK